MPCVLKSETSTRIGIMGGTFDPIHNGHLFIAEEARVRCNLSRVLFLPNNTPAHREGKVAYSDAQTRLDLVQLAIADNAHFEISSIEVEREGPSYAFDTLLQLQNQYPGAQLFWIVGADSIDDVPTWYRGNELFTMCHFIALTRPGYDLQNAARNLNSEQRERVILLEGVGLPLASRELRQRVKSDLPLRYLVPDMVEREITKRGLYR